MFRAAIGTRGVRYRDDRGDRERENTMNNDKQNQFPESETTTIQTREELMTVLGDDALASITGGCGGGGGGKGGAKGGGKGKKKKMGGA